LHGRVPRPKHWRGPRSAGARYCPINYRDLRHIPAIALRPFDVEQIIRSGERMTEITSEVPVRRGPFWPQAVITLGLSLTAAWVILLGYGLVKLIEIAV
jgi:hypothetical protein